jgi:hypothetical protein
VTFDLIHEGYTETERVNAKTFARMRDEVGSTAIDKREACVCKLTYTASIQSSQEGNCNEWIFDNVGNMITVSSK